MVIRPSPCLTFIACAVYRGHRVRRDCGLQRHRSLPEAAGKTTKEEQAGWASASLVLQGLFSLEGYFFCSMLRWFFGLFFFEERGCCCHFLKSSCYAENRLQSFTSFYFSVYSFQTLSPQNNLWMRQKKWDHHWRPLTEQEDLAYLSVIFSPARRAPFCPVMYCCFNHKRKLLPTHHLFQLYKCNKYLSTKIAHLSDHKWGWVLHWSPDVRAEELVFIQHMGRPVIKKVCAKQETSRQQNSSTHAVRPLLKFNLQLASLPATFHTYYIWMKALAVCLFIQVCPVVKYFRLYSIL